MSDNLTNYILLFMLTHFCLLCVVTKLFIVITALFAVNHLVCCYMILY